MSKPFFSVIVPEHNSSEFMRKGLDSIRRQTFKDYELIIVCDACDDKTVGISCEYGDRIFQTDAGKPCAARNKGLDEARGEWILFMDDDDWWMREDAFQIIADNVGKHGEDVLAFGFHWQSRGDTFPTPEQPWTAIWHKAWKKEFLDRIGARFPDWAHSDDDGFSKATLPNAKIEFMHEVLYYYNFLRPGSLTWQMDQGLIPWDFPGR